MKKQRYILLLILALQLTAPAGFAAEEQFVVVVNKDNPVNSLKQSAIKKIFLGRQAFWDDGHKIDVFLLTEKPLQKDFITKMVNKSLRQFKMYWRRELYSGTGVPPHHFDNSQSLKAEVVANSRAIGYINAKELDNSIKPVVIIFDD